MSCAVRTLCAPNEVCRRPAVGRLTGRTSQLTARWNHVCSECRTRGCVERRTPSIANSITSDRPERSTLEHSSSFQRRAQHVSCIELERLTGPDRPGPNRRQSQADAVEYLEEVLVSLELAVREQRAAVAAARRRRAALVGRQAHPRADREVVLQLVRHRHAEARVSRWRREAELRVGRRGGARLAVPLEARVAPALVAVVPVE